jgi:nucleotide-binding universal stress UspA family protein
MKIHTILLAADFSGPAKAAACQARLLAERFGARLKLLHVLDYPLAIPGAPEHGARLGEWFTGRAEEDVVALRSFFAGELGAVHVDYLVLEGDPAKRIVEYADSNEVDLIVMPAHGQGPFRRFLLGSVTAKVLHDVECPVWTGVHLEEPPCCESLKIDNVVCAVDLGPQSAKIIAWASAAAASFDARLFLVHVLPKPDPATRDSGPDLPAAAAGAWEHLDALKKQCGTEAKVILASGEIHEAVCHQTEELNADLLVIGRSPQSGIFGRLPTHAYAIVRDSRSPVVSV